ncbi:hypothetical protein Tco_1028018, partial [Tanacetum coccineum]
VGPHLLLFQKLQKGLVVSGAIHSSQAFFYKTNNGWMILLLLLPNVRQPEDVEDVDDELEDLKKEENDEFLLADESIENCDVYDDDDDETIFVNFCGHVYQGIMMVLYKYLQDNITVEDPFEKGSLAEDQKMPLFQFNHRFRSIGGAKLACWSEIHVARSKNALITSANKNLKRELVLMDIAPYMERNSLKEEVEEELCSIEVVEYRSCGVKKNGGSGVVVLWWWFCCGGGSAGGGDNSFLLVNMENYNDPPVALTLRSKLSLIKGGILLDNGIKIWCRI